jgi:hypothetical protein
MANPMGKTRPVDKPYLIVEAGGWTWRVLKAWSIDPTKPGARWFCSVSSPYTFGGADMGDTYVTDVRGDVTFRDPVVTDDMLPLHLGGKRAAAKNPLDELFGY